MVPRTFLITGASKGIGLALSERLVDQGHKVVGIARETARTPFPGLLVNADLSDTKQTASLLKELVREHLFDGVVNNVGLVRPEPLGRIHTDTLDAVLSLNLHPALLAVQAVLPILRSKQWGRIVNISSLTILGAAERTSYAAAKAALASFAKGWALELASEGITVNTVAPGPTETELFRENNPPGSAGERRYLSHVPMGRFARPEEIAAVIGFLLSEEASFITGQTIFVDGGSSVGKALS